MSGDWPGGGGGEGGSGLGEWGDGGVADVSETLGIRSTAVVRFPFRCVPPSSDACVRQQPSPEFCLKHDMMLENCGNNKPHSRCG